MLQSYEKSIQHLKDEPGKSKRTTSLSWLNIGLSTEYKLVTIAEKLPFY